MIDSKEGGSGKQDGGEAGEGREGHCFDPNPSQCFILWKKTLI